MTAQGRREARCPRCGCLERHRHLWLYLVREFGILERPLDVLHVAPDEGLDARMRRAQNLSYVSGDPDAARGPERIDLTALGFPDEAFDLVIAFHVLEHVEDDGAALREIRRVLRPRGVALLQVPTRPGPTLEDPSLRTPQERLAAFGQEDHVRVYGDDFPGRVAAAGLAVEEVLYRDAIPAPERERHGLLHRHAEDPLDPRLWTFLRAEKRAQNGSRPRTRAHP